MAKKRKTQYSKQRNRVTRYISKLKKQGKVIDLYFPTERELRKQGIKGTELSKLTRQLKSITPAYLKSIAQISLHTTQEDTNTPGFIPPENISEDGSFFERVVISQWYANLDQYSNGEAYNLLRSWMGNTVRTEGEHDTAIMLEDGASNGHIVTWEVVYKTDNALLYIGYMLDYLPDEGVLYKDDVLDRLEYMKRLGDALEQDEDWEYPL